MKTMKRSRNVFVSRASDNTHHPTRTWRQGTAENIKTLCCTFLVCGEMPAVRIALVSRGNLYSCEGDAYSFVFL